MRTQRRSLTIVMLIITVSCGMIGCKSNGGSWYKPSTYSFHNPFKNRHMGEEMDYQFADDASPRDGLSPEVSVPPGGYTESRVASSQSVTVPNNGVPSATGSRFSVSNNTPQLAMNQQPAGYSQQQSYQQNPQPTYQQGYAQQQGYSQQPSQGYAQPQEYSQQQAYSQQPAQQQQNYTNSGYDNSGAYSQAPPSAQSTVSQQPYGTQPASYGAASQTTYGYNSADASGEYRPGGYGGY